MINSSNYYCELYPKWISRIDKKNLTSNFFKIINFYILICPLKENMSFQNYNLNSFGWDKEAWNSYYYLKYYLDKNVFYGKEKKINFKTIKKEKDNKLFKEKGFDDNFYKNLNIERVLIKDTENNKYKSLFTHIRCSLAHGRFNIFINKTDNKKYYVMENGKIDNKMFKLSARMILKEDT